MRQMSHGITDRYCQIGEYNTLAKILFLFLCSVCLVVLPRVCVCVDERFLIVAEMNVIRSFFFLLFG